MTMKSRSLRRAVTTLTTFEMDDRGTLDDGESREQGHAH